MTISIDSKIGIAPVLRKELNRLYTVIAAQDDTLVFALTPATLGTAAATASSGLFSRDIKVELKDSSGEVVPYDVTVTIGVADVTAGDGSSAIYGGGTTLELREGVGTVTVAYSDTWAEGDTNTLTVSSSDTILGSTMASKTSVDTIVA